MVYPLYNKSGFVLQKHSHTLKKNTQRFDDLKDFIDCYNSSNLHKRKEIFSEANPKGLCRKYNNQEIITRGKTSLDIPGLKDKSLADLDNLPDPAVLAEEIAENLESGLENLATNKITLFYES